MRISDWSSDVCSSDLNPPKSSPSLLAVPARARSTPFFRFEPQRQPITLDLPLEACNSKLPTQEVSMPHFIAEYTDNIEQQAALPGLFEKVHALLGDSGVFPLGGLRSRGVRLVTWCLADGTHS